MGKRDGWGKLRGGWGKLRGGWGEGMGGGKVYGGKGWMEEIDGAN